MQVFHKVGELDSRPRAVAVGNFDGLHQGHRELARSMVNAAKEEGLVSSVLTFFPHPVEVLRPGTRLERIYTPEEKLKAFEELGVDQVLVEPFRKELSEMEPESFFDFYLSRGMTARRVHVGFDFHFGRDRSGNVEVLGELCQRAGVPLHVVQPVEVEGEKVSSTRIRAAIREGRMEAVTPLLGEPYSISGVVVPGAAKGRGLGFPTANLRVPSGKILPKEGVYVTRAVWQKQSIPSVSNVGRRPTVTDEDDVVVETHLLGIDVKLYDESIRVEFLHRLREERKFDSLEALQDQIQRDVAATRVWHGKQGGSS